jgi:hypothetical protein
MLKPAPVSRPPRKLASFAKIRCSADDLASWQAKAHAAGLSLSALVRQAVGGASARRIRRPVSVDPVLLRQLAAIGNNLNQLARWANREKSAANALPVVARLIEIDRELAAIRRTLETPHAD